jgi:hypothetical protein
VKAYVDTESIVERSGANICIFNTTASPEDRLKVRVSDAYPIVLIDLYSLLH